MQWFIFRSHRQEEVSVNLGWLFPQLLDCAVGREIIYAFLTQRRLVETTPWRIKRDYSCNLFYSSAFSVAPAFCRLFVLFGLIGFARSVKRRLLSTCHIMFYSIHTGTWLGFCLCVIISQIIIPPQQQRSRRMSRFMIAAVVVLLLQ